MMRLVVEGVRASKAMKQQTSGLAPRAVAEAVRAACLRAALDGYERAGLSGLCEEGRWEMVVDSLKSLDVEAVVRNLGETIHTSRPSSAAR
ncbi:MAG: hypothetical protein ACREFV_12475 [Acetobacteraceae bacterium]